jgi:uncharacterized protein (TIGR00297 family)
MEPFGTKSMLLATATCSAMAYRAVRNRSLTVSGAVAGLATGWILVCTGLRGYVLFFFYQVGSWATKYKHSIKERTDATVATHANRGAVQVLCVSLIACVLSLYHALQFGPEQAVDFSHTYAASCTSMAVTAHHATGLADTLASELGILAAVVFPGQSTQKWLHRTVLVTHPWRIVPPGTNGGITIVGCLWSIVGGGLVGLCTVGMDAVSGLHPQQYAMRLILYAAMIGLIGSLLDSLLGATCQATYYDASTQLVYHASTPRRPTTAHLVCGRNLLSNEGVNLVSTALTVVLGGWVVAPLVME